MSFFLSNNGRQVGPWSVKDILAKLESQELKWTDYIYDEPSKEWMLLMDHLEFSDSFRSWVQPEPIREGAPIIEPDPKTLAAKSENEWFILKDSNKHGPFGYLELVGLLQQKALFEYDFVWNSSLTQWKRVAELETFGPEKIKALRESADTQAIFFRRRHARASHGASLLVHNSHTVWKGRGLELSPGGAGIVIDQADFFPGQTLFLHFKAGDGVPPFNAICSVVSKQHVKPDDSNKTEVRYGVKFVNISQSIQNAIRTYIEKTAA